VVRRRGSRPAAAAVLLCLAAGCALPHGPSRPPDASASGPAPLERPYPAISDGVLVEVNRARQKAGAAPLQAMAALDRVALEYAYELAERGLLDHRSPTPGRETMVQRIEAGGVAWRRAAENLAFRGGPASDVAVMVVAGWLSSPRHQRNLLDVEYTRSGVGVARAASGTWYVVQVYVLPAGRRE
jgi:uncharacterized protein YkwD